MTDTHLPPLYDEEKALRQLARHRLKRDTLTLLQVRMADDLAAHIRRHFSAGETETAGRALLVGAASCAGLAGEYPDVPPSVMLNILGFAAARMISDGRDWLGAQGGDDDG